MGFFVVVWGGCGGGGGAFPSSLFILTNCSFLLPFTSTHFCKIHLGKRPEQKLRLPSPADQDVMNELLVNGLHRFRDLAFCAALAHHLLPIILVSMAQAPVKNVRNTRMRSSGSETLYAIRLLPKQTLYVDAFRP